MVRIEARDGFVSVKGHAKDRDVCLAISVQVYALVANLDRLPCGLKADFTPGNTWLKWKTRGRDLAHMDLLFFLRGLRAMEEQYPQEMVVRYERNQWETGKWRSK